MAFFDFLKPKPKLPKKGDTVICIDDRDWNTSLTNIRLEYNKKYEVLGIIKHCHGYALDINARNSSGRYTSCSCGNDIPGSGIHWAKLARFKIATAEEASESREDENEDDIDDKIANAILEENYELAGELNERKNS